LTAAFFLEINTMNAQTTADAQTTHLGFANRAADLETPVSAFLKLGPLGVRFLLESADRAGSRARYSFLGFGPTHTMDRALADPLSAVPDICTPPGDGLLGGAVGYISYDYVRRLENLPCGPESTWPLMSFVRVDALLVFDHYHHRMNLLVSGQGGHDDGFAKEVIRALARPAHPPPRSPGRALAFHSDFPRRDFEEGVTACREAITRGDAFQIVLSRSERATLSAHPFEVYRAMRMTNPSPYMFYLDFGDRQLVGASPEMLARCEGDRAHLTPIAGTRRRGGTEAKDEELTQELLSDDKERSEHVMLVDLARNDLSRCCRPGTVEVGQYCEVEKYSHVQHLVSRVQGTLSPGRNAFDLLRAAFPAGTVTGAPKVRAMEILGSLEPVNRGPYGGCVGYFTALGDSDTCLTIRSVAVEGDTAVVQAGAGVVADSRPAREYEETVEKLAAVKQALRLASEGLP
jgi:anthranilate synthase component 1